MKTETTLKDRILARCRVYGDFTLRSGQHSDVYYDKYLFESDPILLNAIVDALDWHIPNQRDYLAGMELGGSVIATALSLTWGIPQVFIRKQPKTYGTAKIVEGADICGKTLCIVEDVITTGESVVTAAQVLRDCGATVEQVLCVILRDEVGRVHLRDHGLSLATLITPEDL